VPQTDKRRIFADTVLYGGLDDCARDDDKRSVSGPC